MKYAYWIPILLLSTGCDKKNTEQVTPAVVESPTEHKESPRAIVAPPPKVKEVSGIERRLYVSQVEASSFLWVNFNRFQQNYHPNYLMDGDKDTTWIEGAEGNGHGEWVEIKTSPIANASKLRLRVHNGYHKSKELFLQNARAKEVELQSVSSGRSQRFTLADTMEWQELSLSLGNEDFSALKLTVISSYAGSKYEDLCISDLEVYVTGTTKENPSYENGQLKSLRRWVERRADAAKVFASGAGKDLPIRGGYRVLQGERVKLRGAKWLSELEALEALRAKVPSNKYLARAEKSLKKHFKNWSPHEIEVKGADALPEVYGLRLSAGGIDLDWTFSDFEVPVIGNQALLQAQRISLGETKLRGTPERLSNLEGVECDDMGGNRAMASVAPNTKGPTVRELVIWRCGHAMGREEIRSFDYMELLEFDDEGWLRASVSYQGAQYFDWSTNKSGKMVLQGGGRYDAKAHRLDLLVVDEQSTE